MRIYVIVEECYCDCSEPGDKPEVSVISAFVTESDAQNFKNKANNSCYRIEPTELVEFGGKK